MLTELQMDVSSILQIFNTIMRAAVTPEVGENPISWLGVKFFVRKTFENRIMSSIRAK